MLRVSDRVFIAESLPIANNERQRAHLELYNLRQEIFEALFGEKDDLHYFPLEKLEEFVERAGGRIVESGTFEPNLPHYLAYIPREYVSQIKTRKSALNSWSAGIGPMKSGRTEPNIHPWDG